MCLRVHERRCEFTVTPNAVVASGPSAHVLCVFLTSVPFPLGKEDEFPKKPLGQLPPDCQPASISHLSNGQSVGRAGPHSPHKGGGREGGASPSPPRKPEHPPAHPGDLATPERAGRLRQTSLDEDGKQQNREADAPRQRPTAPRDGAGQCEHAAANRNSNAVPDGRKELLPRWNKPAEASAAGRAGGRPPPSLPAPAPSPARPRGQVRDADDGKRGSNASQYDNVPESDGGAPVEEALERAHSQSPRRHAPSPGPYRVSKFVFKVLPAGHARVPPHGEGADRGALQPPSYSDPPVYLGSCPPHVPAAGHVAPVTPSRRPPGRPAPLVLPSSRIEVLPVDVGAGGHSGSPGSGGFILPPVDYLPESRKWPDVPRAHRPEMLERSWPRDFPRYAAAPLAPTPGRALPAVCVDSPVRFRTGPAPDDARAAAYLCAGPSTTARHYRRRDGLPVPESVLL